MSKKMLFSMVLFFAMAFISNQFYKEEGLVKLEGRTIASVSVETPKIQLEKFQDEFKEIETQLIEIDEELSADEISDEVKRELIKKVQEKRNKLKKQKYKFSKLEKTIKEEENDESSEIRELLKKVLEQFDTANVKLEEILANIDDNDAQIRLEIIEEMYDSATCFECREKTLKEQIQKELGKLDITEIMAFKGIRLEDEISQNSELSKFMAEWRHLQMLKQMSSNQMMNPYMDMYSNSFSYHSPRETRDWGWTPYSNPYSFDPSRFGYFSPPPSEYYDGPGFSYPNYRREYPFTRDYAAPRYDLNGLGPYRNTTSFTF